MKWFKQEKKWKDGNEVEVPKNYAQLKIFSIHSRIIFFLPAALIGRTFHNGIPGFVS